MYEIYVFLFSIVFWGLIYQLVIIPRTASASFSVWRESFWGSISQLGKKAEGLNPNEAMKKAIAKGDLFQILAEYVGNKAGLGGLQGLIPAQEEPKQDQNQGLTKL